MPSGNNQERYHLYYQKARRVYQRPEVHASVEVIVSVFAVALLSLIAIRPTLTTVVTLRKKIEDQSVVEKKLTNKISQLVQVEQQLTEYANDLALFRKALPDSFEYGALSKRLEIIAFENSLTIDTLSFSEVPVIGGQILLQRDKKDTEKKGDTRVSDFRVNLTIRGGEMEIIRFVESIERMDRFIEVKSVTINSSDGKTKAKKQTGLTANISANGYYFMEDGGDKK